MCKINIIAVINFIRELLKVSQNIVLQQKDDYTVEMMPLVG